MKKMFRREKETSIDYPAFNSMIRTINKILKIGFFMAIVCIILLGTYLLKEWKILKIIKEILVVISPVFIGFVIAWLFDPLVTKLEKKKIPRILGCILIYILIIGCIIAFSYSLIPSLVSQVKDFVSAAPSLFEDLTNFSIKLIQRFDTENLVNTAELKKNIMKFITDYGMSIVSDLPKHVLNIGKSVVSGGLNVTLGLMVGFYLLFDLKKVNRSIKQFVPTRWKENYDELLNRINTSLRSYVQGVFIIMLLVFLTQAIGLTIAGMQAPIVFAMFCAITDIIPYFGPYIGGIPAVIVGFATSPITGICVLISIVIVQILENNFYQPLIMGHTMKLHPVTIMLGLLIFQHFFGILGMVIATPVIACIKIFATFFNEKLKIIEPEEEEEEIENKKTKKKEEYSKSL